MVGFGVPRVRGTVLQKIGHRVLARSDLKSQKRPGREGLVPLPSSPDLCGSRQRAMCPGGHSARSPAWRVGAPFLPTARAEGLGSGMRPRAGRALGVRSQEASVGAAEPCECLWVAGFCC